MNRLFLAAFHDELIKLSSVSTDAAKAAPALKVPLKPLAYMGAGAAGVLGAQRMYKDWKMGREMRKAQSQRGY